MIVEYIRYSLSAHTPDQLIEAYRQAAQSLAAAPECIDYDLAQSTDEASAFILRIRWRSADAHLKGFRSGPNFPPFLAAIRAFVPEIAEMRHYAETPVAGSGGGAAQGGA